MVWALTIDEKNQNGSQAIIDVLALGTISV
jgi:hypothetical protein